MHVNGRKAYNMWFFGKAVFKIITSTKIELIYKT